MSSLNDTLFFLHPDFCLTHFRQRQASKGSAIRKLTCSPLLREAWTSRLPCLARPCRLATSSDKATRSQPPSLQVLLCLVTGPFLDALLLEEGERSLP